MPSAEIIGQLRRIVGAPNVLTEREDLIPYSFDGTAALRQMPAAVVFVQSATEVSEILKLANTASIPRRHPRLGQPG